MVFRFRAAVPDHHHFALAPFAVPAGQGALHLAVHHDFRRAEPGLRRGAPGDQQLFEFTRHPQGFRRIRFKVAEVLPAHPADGQIIVGLGIVMGKAAPFHGHGVRPVAVAVQGDEAHIIRAVSRFRVQINILFAGFPGIGRVHRRQQAVRHDAVAEGGGMVLVKEEFLRRPFLPHVGKRGVLDGHHHQIVSFAHLFQLVLQIEPGFEHREQQNHRRVVGLGQDGFHQRFKAPVPGGLLVIVDGKFHDHQIRQAVGVLHPIRNIPLIAHEAEGGGRAAHPGIDEPHVAAVPRAVPGRESPGEPGSVAFLIRFRPRALRNGAADGGNGDFFPRLRPLDHVLQAPVVPQGHHAVLQHLFIPFRLRGIGKVYILAHGGTASHHQHHGQSPAKHSFQHGTASVLVNEVVLIIAHLCTFLEDERTRFCIFRDEKTPPPGKVTDAKKPIILFGQRFMPFHSARPPIR